jgi:hypothetical protein
MSEKLLLEEPVFTHLKLMSIISFAMTIPYTIAVIFLAADHDLFLLVLIIPNIAYIIAGIQIWTMQRTPLRMYESYLEVPITKLALWNNTWALPSNPRVDYSAIDRISIVKGMNIYIELKDGKRYLLVNGMKRKITNVVGKINWILAGRIPIFHKDS